MIELLEPILEKYCKDNFQNSSDVSVKLLEYKKLLLDANQHMNLIGKSTIEDFDQRHFLDCIQIHEYMKEKNNLTIDLGTGAGMGNRGIVSLFKPPPVTVCYQHSRHCRIHGCQQRSAGR